MRWFSEITVWLIASLWAPSFADCPNLNLAQPPPYGKKTLKSPNGSFYVAYEGIQYDTFDWKTEKAYDKNMTPMAFGTIWNKRRVVDCLQLAPADDKIVGSEDCKFLNIYAPKSFEKKSRPVLIWLPGTAFPVGSSQASMYDPRRFMDFDIVVVTVSYRLDVLGFVSLGRDEMLGNFGLTDQKLAIDWVIKNINHFGGDPEQITLGGHGMGASHALFHMRRKDFADGKVIKRCLAMSGTRFAPWALSYKEQTKGKSYQLARMMKCEGKDSACIKNTDYNKLVQTSYDFMMNKTEYIWESVIWPFKPVVDNRHIMIYPWLEESESSQFSLLLGLAIDEGHLISTMAHQRKWSVEQEDILFNTFFKLNHPIMLRFKKNMTEETKNMYDQLGYCKERLETLTSDGFFFYPAMMEAENHTGQFQAFMSDFPTHLGVFGCSGPRMTTKTVHGDELPYLFHIKGCPVDKSNRYSAKLVNAIANFVKFGDAKLSSYSVDNELFDITSALTQQNGFTEIDWRLTKRMDFWRSLKLYRIPAPHMDTSNFTLMTTKQA